MRQAEYTIFCALVRTMSGRAENAEAHSAAVGALPDAAGSPSAARPIMMRRCGDGCGARPLTTKTIMASTSAPESRAVG